jgi:hypothetical protein
MNNLLLDDKPLVVIPSLAVAVGLDESIVLQQLHYWLLRSTNERDGRKWVYNTTKEWAQQFPFWTEEVIKRIMRSLRDKEVVITARYNEMKIDRTLWYTIDYDKLNAIVSNAPMVVANDPTNGVKPPDAIVSNDPTNNQRIPETTTPVVVVDKTPGDVFTFFENNMPGSMTDFIAKALGELIDTYGPGEVHTAIEKALLANVRKLTYIEQILVNRAAGTDKPQKKEQRNYGTYRKADTNSSQHISSAEAEYVMPAKYR